MLGCLAERDVTAEVALLNKSAIALAADSATTVTYWDKNEPKIAISKERTKSSMYRKGTRSE